MLLSILFYLDPLSNFVNSCVSVSIADEFFLPLFIPNNCPCLLRILLKDCVRELDLLLALRLLRLFL